MILKLDFHGCCWGLKTWTTTTSGKTSKAQSIWGKQRCFAVISVPQPHRIAPTYSRFKKNIWVPIHIHKGSEKKTQNMIFFSMGSFRCYPLTDSNPFHHSTGWIPGTFGAPSRTICCGAPRWLMLTSGRSASCLHPRLGGSVDVFRGKNHGLLLFFFCSKPKNIYIYVTITSKPQWCCKLKSNKYNFQKL